MILSFFQRPRRRTTDAASAKFISRQSFKCSRTARYRDSPRRMAALPPLAVSRQPDLHGFPKNVEYVFKGTFLAEGS